jgi:hypothetical protein
MLFEEIIMKGKLKVAINNRQVSRLSNLLLSAIIPLELESVTHKFEWNGSRDELANAYLVIVAICHQTTPIGERRLGGYILGKEKFGWDYLKEKFLIKASENKEWVSPEFWSVLNPTKLSELFVDNKFGMTLNRINERAYLINDLGTKFKIQNYNYISEALDAAAGIISGRSGFLEMLSVYEAYKDPQQKKSLFFLSLAINECGWEVKDKDNLLSPIDYHELRGHLRIGTISVLDPELRKKVNMSLPISNEEDKFLRAAAQEVNNTISEETGLTSSSIHYLFWNIFRNCCPYDFSATHCAKCPPTCKLRDDYKNMDIYHGSCISADICESSGKPFKVTEPPYLGHYY